SNSDFGGISIFVSSFEINSFSLFSKLLNDNIVGFSERGFLIIIGRISEESNSTKSMVSFISSTNSSSIIISLGLEFLFLIFMVFEKSSVSIGIAISIGSLAVGVGWIFEHSNSTYSLVSVISSATSAPISLSLGLEIL